MNLFEKEAKRKAENKTIRNVFIISTVLYWVGFILVSIDEQVYIGTGYLIYILIIGFITGFSAMIIKTS